MFNDVKQWEADIKRVYRSLKTIDHVEFLLQDRFKMNFQRPVETSGVFNYNGTPYIYQELGYFSSKKDFRSPDQWEEDQNENVLKLGQIFKITKVM